MTNVTLSMSESLRDRARAYARGRGTSLNQLVRDLLEKEVGDHESPRILEMFRLADEMGLRAEGGFLTREEANERW